MLWVSAQSHSNNETSEEVYHVETNLKKGDTKLVKISVNDIYAKKPNLDTSKNLIAIHVQNDVISQGILFYH